VSNFLLNRRFTFGHARDRSPWPQLAGFVTASFLGMVINYSVAFYLERTFLADAPYSLHLAALCGIASGMIFNFLGNRFIVFRKRYVKRA
jgi:dolichol-phosphate mannosyltransferase